MNDKTEQTAVKADTIADIADFDTVKSADDGAVMEVRNPKTGDVFRHADGRPFTITFRGRDSEAFRNLARAQQDRRIAAATRTRAPVLSSQMEKDDIELIVAATLKWDLILEGAVAPSNQNTYRTVYTKYPWLKEQGDEFVGVRANFIKTS